jgi:F-type H+-transporting ATPase subunit delta
VRESIAGYADAVVERAAEAGSLPAVASDLTAVQGLLDSSDDLRSVLVDPGLPAHVRRAVVTDLLKSRIDADALRLVAFAAETDRATEFADDLSWLAARVAAARDNLVAVGGTPLGRHAAAERLNGYASAVLEAVADSGDLGEVEDEMFRFSRVVDGSDGLRTALGDGDLPAAVRRGLVVDLLSGKASAATTGMAAYATQVGRPRDYTSLLGELVERVAEESNRRVAEVRAAVDMDDGQRRRLGEALKRLTGRDVDVRVAVDRSVLGGFVATIGDTVVDGSARHRLDLLKERLVAAEPTIIDDTRPAP